MRPESGNFLMQTALPESDVDARVDDRPRHGYGSKLPGATERRVVSMYFQNSSISTTRSIDARTASESLFAPSARLALRSVRSSTKKALRAMRCFLAAMHTSSLDQAYTPRGWQGDTPDQRRRAKRVGVWRRARRREPPFREQVAGIACPCPAEARSLNSNPHSLRGDHAPGPSCRRCCSQAGNCHQGMA